MEFIEILNEIMKEKELTQTLLAEKVGVKQSQVSEWLKGKSKPGYDNLKAICKALNISGDEILGLSEEFIKKNWIIFNSFLFLFVFFIFML